MPKVLESIRGVVELLEALRRVQSAGGYLRRGRSGGGHATYAVGAGGCGGHRTCLPQVVDAVTTRHLRRIPGTVKLRGRPLRSLI